MHKYSKIEDQFLIENVKGITLKELTKKFNEEFNVNVTEASISNRKVKLGIKSGIVGGQFQKGQVSHNKGKKMSKLQYEKSKATMFKKGNIPANVRDIGSERIDRDGYLLIKIQNGHGNNNWIRKHRYLYEQAYGKIPKGYRLIFADGNKRNFDLSNLILISGAEGLIMNKYKLIKNDKELTKTGVVIAKLLDKVNKKSDKVNSKKDL